MQYVPNPGELAAEDAMRDAIHVAVAPVVAAVVLLPGERVWLDEAGRAFFGSNSDWIGVVDPFLAKVPVEPGQRFWLFLRPNTVTSLRHAWTHPAFKAKPPEGVAAHG